MKKQQGEKLLQKLKENTITEQERLELERWYLHYSKTATPMEDIDAYLRNRTELDRAFPFEIEVKPAVHRLWPGLAAAIAIILILGAVFFYFSIQRNTTVPLTLVNDIQPATNKAILTLANGKHIQLTDAKNGALAKQANIQITKTTDGGLIYKVIEPLHQQNANREDMNTIETPKGGKYEITLTDGTHVWINAASSLKFPASFALLKERRVELTGEAFFQVAHNKNKPFKVISAGQTVEVLGTQFNVNAYSDENAVKTTLLQGSVKLSNNYSKRIQILTPGQQGVFDGKTIQVSETDTEQALGWKNGDFVFNGDDLQTVMRQLSRWYDIDVVYQGTIDYPGFVSTISRTKKLSEILKVLEMNRAVHFKIEGRRVVVMH